MLVLFTLSLYFSFGHSDARRRRCAEDCSQHICGKDACGLCTSEQESFDLSKYSNTLRKDNFHLVYHYQKPEGVCYNQLEQSQKNDCIHDGDCESWQMCMTDYSRKDTGIDWDSKHSYCVSTGQMTVLPAEKMSLRRAPVPANQLNAQPKVEKEAEKVELEDHASKRSKAHKKQQCIHDCGKTLCGEVACSMCTATHVSSEEPSTPTNSQYYEAPEGKQRLVSLYSPSHV